MESIFKVPESTAYLAFAEEVRVIKERQDIGILATGQKLVVERDRRNHIIGIQIE